MNIILRRFTILLQLHIFGLWPCAFSQKFVFNILKIELNLLSLFNIAKTKPRYNYEKNSIYT